MAEKPPYVTTTQSHNSNLHGLRLNKAMIAHSRIDASKSLMKISNYCSYGS